MHTAHVRSGEPLPLLEHIDVYRAMQQVLAEYAQQSAVKVEYFDVPGDTLRLEGGASSVLTTGSVPLAPPAEWVWHAKRLSVLGGPVRVYAGGVAVGSYRTTLGGTHGQSISFDYGGLRLAPGMAVYVENVESSPTDISLNIGLLAVRVTHERLIH